MSTENDERPVTAGDSILGTDPLQTAADLTSALTGMTRQLAEVKKTVRRGKRVIAALVCSLILDLALTAGVAFNTIQADNAVSRANATVSQLHASQVTGCQAGNLTRKADVTLWTHLAAVSKAPPHLTRRQLAANRRAIASLLDYIRHVFAPRNCAQAYPLTKGTASGR